MMPKIALLFVILNINNHYHEAPYNPCDDTYEDLAAKWCSWHCSPRNMLKSKEAQADNSYFQAIEDVSIESFKHLILQSQSSLHLDNVEEELVFPVREAIVSKFLGNALYFGVVNLN